MNYSDLVSLFEELASSHKDLRHNEEGDYPTGKRKSFFRANGREELVQDAMTQVDYPLMEIKPLTGRYDSDNEHLVEDIITVSFEIRMKADPYAFADIDAARDECKRIGNAIIAELHRLYLDEGHAGPIGEFDPKTVRYDYPGPVNEYEYGVIFTFTSNDFAYNISDFDLDTEFQRNE